MAARDSGGLSRQGSAVVETSQEPRQRGAQFHLGLPPELVPSPRRIEAAALHFAGANCTSHALTLPSRYEVSPSTYPFGSAARVFAQFKEAQGAMRRLFEILDTRPEVSDRPDAVDIPPIQGHVQAAQLGFAYDPRQPRACRLLLVQGSPGHEAEAPGEGWVKLADVGRPGDRAERHRLYRSLK